MTKFSLLFLGLWCFTASALQGQVQFNLSLLSDEETFLVSVVSSQTYDARQSITGSGQVVVRVPAEAAFLAGDITSMIDGVDWQDNGYIYAPEQDPLHDYVTFVLASPFTKNIQYVAEEEIPLFSFKNVAGDCPGHIELIDNDDPSVQALVQSGMNVTQNLSVYGARGNAFTGVLTSTVDCEQLTTNNDDLAGVLASFKLYPQPARELVTVEWTLAEQAGEDTTILIYDQSGKLAQKVLKDYTGSANRLQVDVSDLAAGLYAMRLQVGKQVSSAYKLLVVR